MTTILTIPSYNVNTSKHQGTFPNVYWESARVELYCCPKVSVSFFIYPTGSENNHRGYVSAWASLYCEDPNVTVKSHIAFTIAGKTWTTTEIAYGMRGDREFGSRSGWPDFCAVGDVILACILPTEGCSFGAHGLRTQQNDRDSSSGEQEHKFYL